MREATLWTLHLLAGVIILILLGIHMGIMHLESILLALGIGYKDTLDWAAVAVRNKQLFFTISYVVLLGAALYHGFYGLRNIILELNVGPGGARVVNVVLVVLGVALFALGTVAAIAAYVQ